MLQTLALFAAMSFSPAQGGLTLSNERITFGGQFGPTRPDARFLPGDVFFLVFDMNGLKQDQVGHVEYSIGMVVTDPQGKVIFEEKPTDQQSLIPLGASKFPARAFFGIGLDLRGKFNCKVTVTDKSTSAAKSIEKEFEVLPPAFGIVGFNTSYDREGNMPSPMRGFAGQAIYLHFVTVNFTRGANKQPHNTIEMRILDAANNQTTEKPLVFEVKSDVKEESNGIDWDLFLPLNRPGSYTVELKAEDKLTGKTYKMTFPLVVYDSIK